MKKEELDEHLETLWHLQENDESDIDNFKHHMKGEFNEDIIQELKRDNYITLEGDRINLTKKGYAFAEQIIRRHRLAERLLTDVLAMELGEIEKGACEFEHILAPELVESICTLLGHPKECPHGGRIPEGECCKQTRKTLSSAVVSLVGMDVGEEVKVAYINTRSNSRMHKLSHFGIVPGTSISIHQRSPSFVVKCGNTQIALEEDIAKEIHVWKTEKSSEVNDSSTPRHRRRRFGRKKW